MRKLSLLATLSMVATLVFAPTAVAQDVDCPQLTFAEAQAILAEDPSDPNGLDDDNDGTACDANAGDGSTASPMAEEGASPAAADVDCEESVPQAQEQAILDADPSDPNGLDGDDDGIACEEPGNDDSISIPTEEQYDNDAAAAVQYDDESATATATATASPLPDTGGVASPAALSLIAALLLVGGGILSASIVRRR